MSHSPTCQSLWRTALTILLLQVVLLHLTGQVICTPAFAEDTTPTEQEAEATKESPVNAVLLIHADESGLLTIGEQEYMIGANEFKSRFDELVKGQPHLEIRMEDWKNAERVLGDLMIGGFDLGIREVTWHIEHDGKTHRRTAKLQPPSLIEQLKDPKRQAEALQTATQWITSDVPREVTNAMAVVNEAHKLNIKFDKKPFLEPVRKSLASDPPDGNLSSALLAIGIVGGDESDIPTVIKHIDHPKMSVRAVMGRVLVSLDKQGTRSDVAKALLKLLDDPPLQTHTIKSMWGHALAPEVEDRLIQLSYHPMNKPLSREDKVLWELANTTIYYALSTRPILRLPVAHRLAEISQGDVPYEGRAVWGLSHHQVADEKTRVFAMETFLRVIDSSTDQQVRRDGVYGLGYHGVLTDDDATARLKELAEDPNEPQMIRDTAAKSLRSILNKPKSPPV